MEYVSLRQNIWPMSGTTNLDNGPFNQAGSLNGTWDAQPLYAKGRPSELSLIPNGTPGKTLLINSSVTLGGSTMIVSAAEITTISTWRQIGINAHSAGSKVAMNLFYEILPIGNGTRFDIVLSSDNLRMITPSRHMIAADPSDPFTPPFCFLLGMGAYNFVRALGSGSPTVRLRLWGVMAIR